MELVSAGRLVDRAPVMSNGSFELRGMASGDYELRVAYSNETIVQRRFLSVHGPVDGVAFRIEATASERPRSRFGTCARLLPSFRITWRRTTISAFCRFNRVPMTKPPPSFRRQ